MRSHRQAVDLAVPPERAFAVLVTPSAIRSWWQAARVIVLQRPGGLWMAAWGADEDDPDYVTGAILKTFDPPRQLTMGDFHYHARTGPLPFEADLATTFRITPRDGGCTLEVEQTGFPDDPVADDFYQACDAGWRTTLEGIRRYLDA